MHICCVHFLFSWLILCVIVLSLLSNEVACAAPKTVIHFLKQGSYFVCVDLGYTVVVKWGYIKKKQKLYLKMAEVLSSLLGN